MKLPRASRILLHPASLPGPYGIGDLGPEAHRFAGFLASAGQKLWQVLPLGPTGYGDSPYQLFSAFAGNPMLISPERLVEQGILQRSDLAGVLDDAGVEAGHAPSVSKFSQEAVNYEAVNTWKTQLLRRATN